MQSKAIGEVALSVGSGLTPLRSDGRFWASGTVPWLKTEQLGEKFIYDTSEKITEVALQKTSIKLNPENTISIAMYGEGKTRGSVSIIKAPMTTNQACCNVVINPKLADYEYVYYYLKTQYENLRQLSSGVRHNLNAGDIRNFVIRMPDNVVEQQKIAAVLSALDAKIDLNHRINAELEALAKTIYDYWFVQFDFPDAHGRPYKSSGGAMVWNDTLKREIPAGWEPRYLAQLVLVSTSGINPADEPEKEFRHLSIPSFDQSGSFLVEPGSAIGSNKFTVQKHDLLVSKLNPWTNRVVADTDHDDLICSTEFVVWRCGDATRQAFLNAIATHPRFIMHCTQSANGTSHSHKRVNPQVMMRFQIPYCPRIAEKFGELAAPLLAQKVRNAAENRELTSLRDWLLPLLMNGQVRVA